ncbi:MAG: DNA polymerase III subunit beta [Armatimonadota bacterium]
MKAVLTKKNLLDGVRTAGHAISGRTALPILGHVLAATGTNSLRLSATDHQIGISTTVPAQILEPGELTLPASIGSEVISSLSDADVIIESNENQQIRILCPPSDFQILGLPPGEFPGLPEVPDTVWFEIDAKQLRLGLRRTQFACSTDELRTILLGVLFSYSGDTLKLVATDTHRLAVDTRLIASGEGEANAVVPARAVAELSRILTDEGKVRVHISERQIMFVVGQVVVTASLIEGQYPNYERVVPADYDKKIVLPTKLFTDAIKRASIVARGDMNRTVVKTSGEKVSVSAKAGAVGKAYEEVEAIREGDDIEVAFNAQFLGEVLDVIDTEGVGLELSGPLSPAVLRPIEQDDYLCVVMPMQIQEGLGD